MANGAPSFLGSVLLHAGVIGLALIAWPKEGREPREMMATVPVSIVSEMTVLAAAPDNPADELITEDGSSSPELPAEVPPVPEPTPTPPLQRPEPVPKTTPRPAPEQPRTPPRQQPASTPTADPAARGAGTEPRRTVRATATGHDVGPSLHG